MSDLDPEHPAADRRRDGRRGLGRPPRPLPVATPGRDRRRQLRWPRRDRPDGVRLELREITVSFDGLTVLDHLTLTLARGEMRFLIGPNGAGKTTLLDVITGKTKPESGTVLFEGYDLAGWQEHDIARRGIGRKFQTPTVFPSLTVRQNMEIAVGARGGFIARDAPDAVRRARPGRRDAPVDRAGGAGDSAGRPAFARREAVAGDRHAGGPGAEAAAAGRAGRRHDPRRARPHGRAAPPDAGGPPRPHHPDRRARHGVRAAACEDGHGAAPRAAC